MKIERKTPTSSTVDGQRPLEEMPKTAIPSGKGVLTLSNELAAKARDYCVQRKEKKELEEEKIVKNKKRIYIPGELRKEALREYHDARPAGHPGVGAIMKKVLKHLWWLTIHRDIHQYVRRCQMCQAAKVNTHPMAPPITPHDVAANPFPFKQVSVDLVTDLPWQEDLTVSLLSSTRDSPREHISCRLTKQPRWPISQPFTMTPSIPTTGSWTPLSQIADRSSCHHLPRTSIQSPVLK